MKAIKEINLLLSRLENENIEWRRMIYDATGVIITDDLYLFSKCGYARLDCEMVFSYSAGLDTTEYCSINSISDIIEYIKAMEVYNEALCDKVIGRITLSELFWAIQSRILHQKDNLNCEGEQDWEFSLVTLNGDSIVFRGALVPCDDIEISLDIKSIDSVEEAIIQFASELNRITESMEGFVAQKVYHSDVIVPESYEDLMRKLFPDGEFAWLQNYEEILINATVYSTRDNASIGFGIYFDYSTDLQEIYEGMEESFWENAYEFEDGMAKVNELEDKGIEDALHEIFGDFNIVFETNIKGWSPQIEVPSGYINEVMYRLLKEL